MRNEIQSVYIKNLILNDNICVVFFSYSSQNSNHATIGVEMIEDSKHTVSKFDRIIKEEEKSFTNDVINFDFEEMIVSCFSNTNKLKMIKATKGKIIEKTFYINPYKRMEIEESVKSLAIYFRYWVLPFYYVNKEFLIPLRKQAALGKNQYSPYNFYNNNCVNWSVEQLRTKLKLIIKPAVAKNEDIFDLSLTLGAFHKGLSWSSPAAYITLKNIKEDRILNLFWYVQHNKIELFRDEVKRNENEIFYLINTIDELGSNLLHYIFRCCRTNFIHLVPDIWIKEIFMTQNSDGETISHILTLENMKIFTILIGRKFQKEIIESFKIENKNKKTPIQKLFQNNNSILINLLMNSFPKEIWQIIINDEFKKNSNNPRSALFRQKLIWDYHAESNNFDKRVIWYDLIKHSAKKVKNDLMSKIVFKLVIPILLIASLYDYRFTFLTLTFIVALFSINAKQTYNKYPHKAMINYSPSGSTNFYSNMLFFSLREAKNVIETKPSFSI